MYVKYIFAFRPSPATNKLNLLTGSSPSPCRRVKFSARKFWEGAKVKSSNRIFGIFFILTFYIILKPIKSQGGNRARSFYELVENLRGVKPNALIFKLTLNRFFQNFSFIHFLVKTIFGN